jgi:hypothetical protein
MKELIDLYNENYKLLKKKSVKTSENGRTSHANGSAESIL